MTKTPSPVKWVGSKARLLPTILEYLPETPKNYFEPFAGGASLFFDYGYKATEGKYLNDICFPLTTLYQEIAKGKFTRNLVDRLTYYQNESYDFIREEFNELKNKADDFTSRDSFTLACDFLVLNYLCFNGLYRENKKGEFNVPLGKDAKGNLYDLDRIDCDKLEECETKLRGAVITNQSFTPWPFPIIPGSRDVVFYDPPYLKEFSGYDKEGFTADHHLLLCAQATAIARKGATVIVCGSNNEASREIYGEPTKIITLQRTVGNFKHSEKKRGKAEEALWVWNKV